MKHEDACLIWIDRTIGDLKVLKDDLLHGRLMHAYSQVAEAAFKNWKNAYSELVLARIESGEKMAEVNDASDNVDLISPDNRPGS